MQINITNITDDEIDYLLSKIGVSRRNGLLGVSRRSGELYYDKKFVCVGSIESTYLEIDLGKLKNLEVVKI